MLRKVAGSHNARRGVGTSLDQLPLQPRDHLLQVRWTSLRAGAAVDVIGRKRVLFVAIAIVALAGAGLPFALALPVVIALRIVQGFGWSGVTPAANTITAELIPVSRRGEGIGYASTIRNLGLAIGSAAGLYIAQKAGYAITFAVAAVFTFVALGFVTGIRETYKPPVAGKIFSLRGLVEMRAVAPSAVSFLMTFVMGGLLTFIPLDAEKRTIGSAAEFFVIFSVILMVVRPLAGRLSDRIPKRGILLMPGLVLVGLSTISLAYTEAPWTLPLAAVLWALGFGGAQPALRAMVLDRSPRRRWGAANATSMILYELGFAVGPLILGFLASRIGIPMMFAWAALAPAIAIILIFITGLHREEQLEARYD